MKKLLLICGYLMLVSCKHNEFKGDKKSAVLPTKPDKGAKDPLPGMPVDGGDGEVADRPQQNDPKTPKAPSPKAPDVPQNPPPKAPEPPKTPPPPPPQRVLTLTVTKLTHDALYKNCLTVVVLGRSYPITCNKDFAPVPPQTITLPNDVACVPIQIRMQSFEPVDTADCIRRIQANRLQHECQYQANPFRTAVLPDAARFSSSVISQQGGQIQSLLVAFEDSDKVEARDFNDYQFSLTAGSDSYLANRSSGIETCIRP